MALAKLVEYFNQMKKAINEIYKKENVTKRASWIYSIVKQIWILFEKILEILKANSVDVCKILEVLGLPTGLLDTGKFSFDRLAVFQICTQAVVRCYCNCYEMYAASSTVLQNKIAKLIPYLGIAVEIVEKVITGVVHRGATESSITKATNNTSRQSLDGHNIHHGGGRGGGGGGGGYGTRYTQTPSSVEYSCFVGYLGCDTKDQALHKAFSVYGEIRHVKIINDQQTGRSKGFGFVTFSNESSMRDAIQHMNGQSLDGRNIAVKEARSRGRGGGGSGRDYRYRGSGGDHDGNRHDGNNRTHGGYDKDRGYRGGIYGGSGGVYGGSHRDGAYGGSRGGGGYDSAGGGGYGGSYHDRNGGMYGGSRGYGSTGGGPGKNHGYRITGGGGRYRGYRITGDGARYRGYRNVDGCGYGGRRRVGSGGACGGRHGGGGGGYGRHRDGNGYGNAGCGGRDHGYRGGSYGGSRASDSSNWRSGSRASDSSNWRS